MLFSLLLLAASTLLPDEYLPSFLAESSQKLHHLCLDFSPKDSQWSSIYSGLVCGSKSYSWKVMEGLKITGLYHLMVVSGTHINILEKLLSTLFVRTKSINQNLLLTVIFLFCLVCELKPPVTRAFVSLLILRLNSRHKWNLRGPQKVFLSGSLCLFLFPSWWNSYSLILSWFSALLISLPLKHRLLKSGALYLGLFPLFLGLQPLSPLTVLTNWLLAPALSLLAFPLALVSYFFHFLNPINDFFWDHLFMLLHLLAPYFEFNLLRIHLPISYSWAYLFGFFLIYIVKVEFWKKSLF